MRNPAPPAPLPAKLGAMRPTMERFARLLLDLLECDRCFIASVSQADGSMLEQVQVGCNGSFNESADSIARAASSWGHGISTICADESTIPTMVLGREQSHGSFAASGRISTESGNDLIFLTGWRAVALPEAEMSCLSRTLGVIWAKTFAPAKWQSSAYRLRALMDELAPPAFAVDEKLQLLYANENGRQLLMAGKSVRSKDGFLNGPNSSATILLRQAVRGIVLARLERKPANTIIPLSTQSESYAFAWVGWGRVHADSCTVLVIVPEMNELAGARRIAMLFGLSWAEERIVVRILQGNAPVRIAEELKLTEATVRTYTKRIMVKLGINRRSELFRLAILTSSPFVSGTYEQVWSPDREAAPANNQTPRPNPAARLVEAQKGAGT